jgi:ADP-ribosylglycohydrolase
MTMLNADNQTVAAELGNGSRVLASDTVPFALWCAVTHLDDFAEACWCCVEVGGDIDTTCAMVGGIIVGCDQARTNAGSYRVLGRVTAVG